MGLYRPVLQILTLFQTKKCNFPHPFTDLAFTQKLCYHYLDKSANKKFFKSISNSHFSLSLTYLEWKRWVRSYTPVVPSKTIPPFFRPKRRRNPAWWGGTHLYSLYKGSLPPEGLRLEESWLFTKSLVTLRVISVKFLLVITLLYKTKWSWELRTWSHKMNLIDTSTNSPHFFYWKLIGITNENLNFDVRVYRVKESMSIMGLLDKKNRFTFFCQWCKGSKWHLLQAHSDLRTSW